VSGIFDVKYLISTFWGLLSWLALSLLIGISYLILCTVSHPYWQAGRQVTIGNERFETIFVINPGPWKTRRPVIEFQLQDLVRIIDSSGGVSVESKENKIYAHTDEGLPPGMQFFITIRSSVTNDVPVPKVTCDGKPCKDTPTFDLNFTLILLLIMGGVCILITALAILLCIQARIALKNEKSGLVAKALEVLLIKMAKGGEEDVKASSNALAEAARGLTQVMQHMHSQPVKKQRNGGQK